MVLFLLSTPGSARRLLPVPRASPSPGAAKVLAPGSLSVCLPLAAPGYAAALPLWCWCGVGPEGAPCHGTEHRFWC